MIAWWARSSSSPLWIFCLDWITMHLNAQTYHTPFKILQILGICISHHKIFQLHHHKSHTIHFWANTDSLLLPFASNIEWLLLFPGVPSKFISHYFCKFDLIDYIIKGTFWDIQNHDMSSSYVFLNFCQDLFSQIPFSHSYASAALL